MNLSLDPFQKSDINVTIFRGKFVEPTLNKFRKNKIKFCHQPVAKMIFLADIYAVFWLELRTKLPQWKCQTAPHGSSQQIFFVPIGVKFQNVPTFNARRKYIFFILFLPKFSGFKTTEKKQKSNKIPRNPP